MVQNHHVHVVGCPHAHGAVNPTAHSLPKCGGCGGWATCAPNGPKWSQMAPTGPNWAQMACVGPKWARMGTCALKVCLASVIFKCPVHDGMHHKQLDGTSNMLGWATLKPICLGVCQDWAHCSPTCQGGCRTIRGLQARAPISKRSGAACMSAMTTCGNGLRWQDHLKAFLNCQLLLQVKI